MSQAILLKDVDGLGEAGAVVDVSPGYLRNYLGPRSWRSRRRRHRSPPPSGELEQIEQAAQQQEERSRETAALLSKTVLTIPHQAGEDGAPVRHRYRQGGGGCDQGGSWPPHRPARDKVESPIRELGTHMVEVEVSEGVTASVKTMVVDQN